MNLSSILGIVIAASVIWFGVISPAARPEIFLNSHAFILVVGGTLAASMISYPISCLMNLLRFVFFGVLFKRKSNHTKLICEILNTAVIYCDNPKHLKFRKPRHPFLEEGYQLIAEGILDYRQLRDVLEERGDFFRRSYLNDARMLSALAKFPPAFGLLGASTGMIAMMSNLSTQGQEMIGPAMALALVATFWGIALANFVLLPLSDSAMKAADDDGNTRRIIIEGLLMIKTKQKSAVIIARLNGFLPIKKRVKINAADFSDKQSGKIIPAPQRAA